MFKTYQSIHNAKYRSPGVISYPEHSLYHEQTHLDYKKEIRDFYQEFLQVSDLTDEQISQENENILSGKRFLFFFLIFQMITVHRIHR